MDEFVANNYLALGRDFQDRVDNLANSIDLMLTSILEKLNAKSLPVLGARINTFEKYQHMWSGKYKGDSGQLINKLKEFNNTWLITKHGTVVAGKSEVTFHKDGQIFSYDENKQEEINRSFSLIINELIQLHESFWSY